MNKYSAIMFFENVPLHGVTFNDRLSQLINPLVHVFLPYTEFAQYTPPGTGTIYPVPARSDQGAADVAWAWVDFYVKKYGRSFLNGWSLFLHNLGETNNADRTKHIIDPVSGYACTAIVGNIDDKLIGPTESPDPYTDKATDGIFRNKGLNGGFGFPGNIAQAFSILTKVKVKMDGTGYTFCARYDNDIESQIISSSTLPITIIPDTWLQSTFLDVRYSTEVVYNGQTFQQLYNSKTMGDGSPLTVDLNQWALAVVNRNFTKWVYKTGNLSLFESHQLVWAQQLKAIGGSRVIYNNYGHTSWMRGGSYRFAYAWWIPEYTYICPHDEDSPVLYPEQCAFINNSSENTAAWRAQLKMSTTGDVTKDASRLNVLNCLAWLEMSAKLGRDLCPWICNTDYPGYAASFEGGTSFNWDMTQIRRITREVVVRSRRKPHIHYWHGLFTISDKAKRDWTVIAWDFKEMARKKVSVYGKPGLLRKGRTKHVA
jgi:hypothetical protein